MSVSVSTMPFIKPHFHDNAGSPATGYKLYSYDSTTQDAIPLYKDPAGSVEYPNPLTLNSRGEPDGMGLYLDDNKTYKLVLKTESNVTVWTVNAVQGVSGGSGSVPVINLPGHTVLGNSSDTYGIAEAVEIVSSITSSTDDDLVVSVGAVKDILDGYLPDNGTNTYTGTLNVNGTVDADVIKVDGVSVTDLFVEKAGHDIRSVVGNKDYTGDVVEDIALVNSIASGSADEIPSVSAVKSAIDTAVSNLQQEINNIGDVNKVSIDGSDDAGYLIDKLDVGDGLSMTNLGDKLQISLDMDQASEQQCFSLSAGHRGMNGYFVRLTEQINLTGQYSGTDYATNFTIPFTRPSYEPTVDTSGFIDTEYNRVIFNRAGKWLLIGEMTLAPWSTHTSWVKGETGLALIINGGSKDVYTAPIDLREKAPQFAYGTYTTYEITAIVEVNQYDYAQFTINEPNLQCYFKFHGVELSSVSANSTFPDSKRIVYVSNKGDDTNDGKTPNKPLATFKSAYNKAKAYQIEEGNLGIWTVVCGDGSIFLEDDLYIPPSIAVYMPFAVINSTTYVAIPEGTNFTCDKVITGTICTTDQSSALQTNVNINTLDVTTDDDYGLITTGTTSTLVNFNIGKLTMTASDWIGNGMIGSVTGGSNKTLNINVDLVQFIGTVSSGDESKGHVIWNNSSCIINAKLGTVNALNATALVGCVSECTIDVDVHKSSTESIIYCVANGSVTVKGGDLLGNLGKYANSPVLTVAGYFTAGTPFVNLNTNQSIIATINLDRFGMVTIGGSDIPGYLKDKVIAGTNVTITENDGTLVISSEAGGEDTYQVKLDSSDTADYLPNKVFGYGAVEVNTVSLGANEKNMQIVGTGKIVVDDNDSDFDYLSDKLKAGNHVTIAVVDDAGIRKVEITADGPGTSITKLDDVPDCNVPSPTDGQVLAWDSTTSQWIAEERVKNLTAGTGISITETFTDSYTIVNNISAGDGIEIGLTHADPTQLGISAKLNNVSAGVASYPAPEWTSSGGANITMPAADVYLYDNANATGYLKKYTVPSASFTLSAGNDLIVIASYNSGSPVYQLVTNTYDAFNHSDTIPVYRFWYDGTTIHSESIDSLGIGLSDKIARRIGDTQYYVRSRNSGLEISNPSGLNIDISSANVWAGAVINFVDTFQSSVHGFTRYYKTSGSWFHDTVSAIDADYINDNSGLVAISNSKYAVRYIYRSIGDAVDAFYVSSKVDYNSVDTARADMPRTDLPAILQGHCMLVGRVILQKSATGFSVVESAFGSTFQAGAGGGSDTYKVMVDSSDSTPDYLASKITHGNGITITNNSHNNLVIAVEPPDDSLQTFAVAVATGGIGSFDGSYLHLTAVFCPYETTVNKMRCYITQTGSNNLYMGIYSYNSSTSTFTLLGQTAAFTPNTAGINAISLTSAVTLASGDLYYLAIGGNANGCLLLGASGMYATGSARLGWDDQNQSTLPATFSGGSTSGNRFWLMAYGG